MKYANRLKSFSAVISLFLFCAFALAIPLAAQNPAAYVYVSSNSSGVSQINAFSASSAGKLTPIPGSPFPSAAQNMALNGKWLFGTDTIDIYTYSIAANGALTSVNSINAQQFNGYNDGGPVRLFLDHTGTTLYDEDIYGNNGANNTYQFFSVNSSSGALNYLGATTAASPDFLPLSFIGNNEYAYGADCYLSGANIYGFSRNSQGLLTDLNISPEIPAATQGGYCPYLAAADPTTHVAVSLTPTDGYTDLGPTQLAVYTADSSGNLTTTSTAANMPKVSVGNITYLNMSPSGKLLAVAGTKGLQVFHFNGANPITHFTGQLLTNQIDQMFWDNSNHLYAISSSAGKLYVYTVTPTSATRASGSPYSIPGALNIIVLPKS